MSEYYDYTFAAPPILYDSGIPLERSVQALPEMHLAPDIMIENEISDNRMRAQEKR